MIKGSHDYAYGHDFFLYGDPHDSWQKANGRSYAEKSFSLQLCALYCKAEAEA